VVTLGAREAMTLAGETHRASMQNAVGI
jgi:hypothetical protein